MDELSEIPMPGDFVSIRFVVGDLRDLNPAKSLLPPVQVEALDVENLRAQLDKATIAEQEQRVSVPPFLDALLIAMIAATASCR